MEKDEVKEGIASVQLLDMSADEDIASFGLDKIF